jgi:hypothetical protein
MLLLVTSVIIAVSPLRVIASCEDPSCKQSCDFDTQGCIADAKLNLLDDLTKCRFDIGVDCDRLKLAAKIACNGTCGTDKSDCSKEEKGFVADCLAELKGCISAAKEDSKLEMDDCKLDAKDCKDGCREE